VYLGKEWSNQETHMPPIILPGGSILDPHDAGGQHLEAHAEQLGLDDIHVVRATVVGQRGTYLVLDRLRPIFKDTAPDAVITYLEQMAQDVELPTSENF